MAKKKPQKKPGAKLSKAEQKKIRKAEAEQAKLDLENLDVIQKTHQEKLREKIFINEYLVDFNGMRAVIAAGYSNKKSSAAVQANRMLNNVNIQKAINERMEARIKTLAVDQEFVIKSLLDIHNRCIQAEPCLDSNGNPTGQFKFDAKAANNALSLIGKHLNMFPTTLRNDPKNPVEAAKTIIYLPSNGR